MTDPRLSVAGLVLNLLPLTNVLAVGDYLTYRSNPSAGEYSRNVGLAKAALFALLFLGMLSAGHPAASCAARSAREQKACAVGIRSRAGALSRVAMPILALLSVVLSAGAVGAALSEQK